MPKDFQKVLIDLALVIIGVGLSFLLGMYVERQGWKKEEAIQVKKRSVEAALRALSAIRDSDIGIGKGRPESVNAACQSLHVALEAELQFIADDEVAKRVDACQEAARVFSWSEKQFQDYDHGMASIRVRQIATATRSTLEAYASDRELPDWADLPKKVSAMAWVFGPMNRESE